MRLANAKAVTAGKAKGQRMAGQGADILWSRAAAGMTNEGTEAELTGVLK